MARFSSSSIIIGIFFLTSSCVHTRLVSLYSSDNIQHHTATRINYLWGLVQPKDIQAQCESNTICQVVSQTNLGYILLSAATLGIVVPQKVVWDCCPSVEKEEKL